MKKTILKWGLVILLMLIIFYFSNQSSNASSTTSSGIVKNIFDLFNLKDVFVFDAFHTLIRKMAHFSIYLLLGFLVYNALFNKKVSSINVLLYSILIVCLYSISDEIHQLFIIGRSCEVRDILIDTIGGSIGSLLYYFYTKLKYFI